MDPKNNRDMHRKPGDTNAESQHNKSNGGHREQKGQPSGQQLTQKKKSGLSQ